MNFYNIFILFSFWNERLLVWVHCCNKQQQKESKKEPEPKRCYGRPKGKYIMFLKWRFLFSWCDASDLNDEKWWWKWISQERFGLIPPFPHNSLLYFLCLASLFFFYFIFIYLLFNLLSSHITYTNKMNNKPKEMKRKKSFFWNTTTIDNEKVSEKG